jgi:hypothetical protein
MPTSSSARVSARSPTIGERSAFRTTRRGSRTLRPSHSILHETRRWRQAAQALKIARADIELTATAFAESDVTHSARIGETR